jgi:hypothetical protein
MSVELLVQVGPAATSVLALVLSLIGLYLQRRDRSPRLKIRVRYEYRPDTRDEANDGTPRIYDDSQEGLYLLLGDFLREYGLEYPQGSPVVRFAISNEGERVVYLESLRLVFRTSNRQLGDRLVLDPVEERVIPYDLARGIINVLDHGAAQQGPVELVPGDGVGYKFELTRLANTLRKEGHTGNVRLTLEATDRLGNAYRRSFSVDTNLWAYPEEDPRPPPH